ncbi:MAG: peptide chain release factor N(5)-glutamine methyltransferase [Eudoraea sp.]|nr:peptide chain release factor N(5)-glutamine methyltransferase [Eudoraea sp.]
MLLKEIKQIFHKELDTLYPRDEVDSFFYILIEHYLDLDRFVLVINPELTISREEEQPFFEALTKLKLETPIQYITGESSFMDMSFLVNEHVLIPRPETEELVHWVISEYNDKQDRLREGLEILDIGTGSGCIAVALAKYFVNAKVLALDLTEEVLNIAAANARRNKVSIKCMRANLFEIEKLDTCFDIIVSNPPYVRESEKKLIQKNVKEYEPEQALFVKDDAPLIFYEKIAQLAANSLKPEGSLFLEINQYLGKETEAVLQRHGFFEIRAKNDVFGNCRMLMARKRSDKMTGS